MNMQMSTEDQRPSSGVSLNNALNYGLFFTKPYNIPPEHLEYMTSVTWDYSQILLHLL